MNKDGLIELLTRWNNTFIPLSFYKIHNNRTKKNKNFKGISHELTSHVLKAFKNFLSWLTTDNDTFYKEFISYWNKSEKDQYSNNNKNTAIVGVNEIYYGILGSGKSYILNKKYNNFTKVRIIFHPSYSYSDFVGQILPKTNDNKVEYKFEPGPFTKILKQAYQNPDNNYVLIIEELNRANAAGVFGDIFQLLDRNQNGESTYTITNFEIAKSLGMKSDFEIYIPANLSIAATLNTSDQYVNVLDTAFQRRWNKIYISNNWNDQDD
ncbi:AAA family ATPase [Mycoplasmopsis phocirhinis]|uniref:AAA family ATPase n=1 Tax=Mycoplasmopsis phocirhinis TaxID=142650 RepID=UPI0013EE956A|nr:AAA family ATPase [Mycoplasmopsis phocirhinis]